jgi:hypothetical protein
MLRERREGAVRARADARVCIVSDAFAEGGDAAGEPTGATVDHPAKAFAALLGLMFSRNNEGRGGPPLEGDGGAFSERGCGDDWRGVVPSPFRALSGA